MGAGELGYFDLEDPATLASLESPMNALSPLTRLVVIDGAQRAPHLLPVPRVLSARHGRPATISPRRAPGRLMTRATAIRVLLS
jgi:hypothetical protein